MAITDITNIVKKTDTIKVTGIDKPILVRKLTVKERETYNDLKHEGFGVVKAGVGGMRGQTANLNMQKVNHADYEANKYLVKCSFTFADNNCTDDDVDELYDLFDEVVGELKRVNKLDLTEEDGDRLSDDIKKQ